jgi:hypothetical protein
MLLDAFKTLHGISEIKWGRSKKTKRLVCLNSSLPIIASHNCDFKKELHIVECTSAEGNPVNVVCNQEGWEEVDFTS